MDEASTLGSSSSVSSSKNLHTLAIPKVFHVSGFRFAFTHHHASCNDEADKKLRPKLEPRSHFVATQSNNLTLERLRFFLVAIYLLFKEGMLGLLASLFLAASALSLATESLEGSRKLEAKCRSF